MSSENNNHIHTYFSAKSSSKAAQLFIKPRPGVQDDEQTSKIREQIKEEGESYELLLKLGDALRFQLRYAEGVETYSEAIALDTFRFEAYEGRGTCYMKTMRFKEALADHLHFALNTEPALYPYYRVGLCHYYNNSYDKASEYLKKAEKFALDENFGEMIIACCFWKCMCLLKQGNLKEAEMVAKGFAPDTKVGHHTSYRRAVFVISGRFSLDEQLNELENEPDDLEYSTAMYGLLVYMKATGVDTQILKKYCGNMLERDRFWACFGYIAALNDKFSKWLP